MTKPLMESEFAPPVVPLSQPVTTTHRVISYTLRLRSGQAYDLLYRLITATYSTGEYYTTPILRLRSGQATPSATA